MTTAIPAVPLNSGTAIPQIGLGTWPMDDAQVADAIVAAAEVGYRHIDTAAKYDNEAGVGEGIRRTGLDRSEFFVTTKLNGAAQGDGPAVGELAKSLDRLGMDYVDLLLIHWPLPGRDEYVATWRTFEKLHREGRARAIGVSNFKVAHLQRLVAECDIVPAVNQVQLSPEITRPAQRAFHAEHGIVTEAYSPLGGSGASSLDSPVVRAIAERLGRTPAQVVLRWHVQQGVVAIPRSTDPARAAANLDVFGFELSTADMDELATLSQGPDAGNDSDVVGH